MPYPFLGITGRSYVQYLDDATGRMLITVPGGSYSMTPVSGAGNVPVPPGDGLWGPEETPPDDEPAVEPPAADEPGPPAETKISAPPGAPDQPAPKAGRTTTPAADDDAAMEG